MTPIALIILVTHYVGLALALVVAALAVFALIEAARASSHAYQSAFRRTKGFWVGVTGAAAAFSVVTLWQTWTFGGGSIFLQLIAATAVGVFLADVRPAVAVRRR
ncbi:MAG: DUF2516 family protein [Rothia sp. (in: high G+C Gram-positive bacteria)]|nr:DUF2516 family protein [Rothia sp. (in: high G+C Gram-positive bacteria)]